VNARQGQVNARQGQKYSRQGHGNARQGQDYACQGQKYSRQDMATPVRDGTAGTLGNKSDREPRLHFPGSLVTVSGF